MLDQLKTIHFLKKLTLININFLKFISGTFPNVGRNAIVNVSEIVCYDIIKEAILKNNLMNDNVPCHFTSAVIAGKKYFFLNFSTQTLPLRAPVCITVKSNACSDSSVRVLRYPLN